MAAASLAEQLGVKKSSPPSNAKPDCEYFTSTTNPARMGNAMGIAYGGCTIGVAIHAACHSAFPNPNAVHSDFKLYSVLGNFLGPTLVDRPILCEVSRVRESRTFKTRRVVVSQKLDNGSVRECLALNADFMKLEEHVLAEYSAAPVGRTDDGGSLIKAGPVHDGTVSWASLGEELLAKGLATEEEIEKLRNMFVMAGKYGESRLVRNTQGGQNMNGMAKGVRTKEDLAGVNIPDKLTSEWTRVAQPLPTEAVNLAALGFNMDGGLSFLPLIHGGEGQFVDDVGPCSSLDFAMRIFYPGDQSFNMQRWHLKERKAIEASGARTYAESRLWDDEGNLNAIMTQACILRPRPGQGRKAGKL
jgi:acyl-CoA thioesterase